MFRVMSEICSIEGYISIFCRNRLPLIAKKGTKHSKLSRQIGESCWLVWVLFWVHSSQVMPRRVKPVRWQMKDCQTTEPRNFDSGFSGKVNLSTLGFNGTPTYLLTTQCVPCITQLGYPLYVPPSLTRRGLLLWGSPQPAMGGKYSIGHWRWPQKIILTEESIQIMPSWWHE